MTGEYGLSSELGESALSTGYGRLGESDGVACAQAPCIFSFLGDKDEEPVVSSSELNSSGSAQVETELL